jgi:hypothetical protein
MNFLFFLLIKISASQELKTIPISTNKNGWHVWDFHSGKIYVSRFNTLYECFPSSICRTLNIETSADTWLVVSPNYEVYVNDDKAQLTYKFQPKDDLTAVLFENKGYTKQFKSTSVNSLYFYLRSPETSSLEIYDIKSWGPSINLLNSLPNENSTWYVGDDGLFAFKVNSKGIFLIKYSLDGSSFSWIVPVPYCEYNNIQQEVFFTGKNSRVFIVCSSINLAYLYNSKDGSLEASYPIENRDVVAVESTRNYFFILYNDTNLVQYTQDFDYVFTYFTSNTQLPQYNSLKSDDVYIVNVYCIPRTYKGCLVPYLHIWEIVQGRTRIFLNYTENFSKILPKAFANNQTTVLKWKKYIFSENLGKQINSHNSFFTPVKYTDRNSQDHIIFFSGGGNVAKGTCGDIFLHDIIVTELRTEEKNDRSLSEIYLIPNGPASPLGDYAATLLQFDDVYYYLVHGGISCDFKRKFFTLFAINIITKEYSTIQYNRTMA